ncbi:hypothetical protein SAMN05444487_102238 [Marininema mesophilum]|uniref:Uncharacterized protein n=1 Tax=Marininema mesophilum TaxID=1048340 RepID=A0A1H2SLC0_9BACL|nr:hypothetical protein [Marininema mesophilum]SDW31904.1 hypothetical protein SAMN05444487_102238 [Marininema mesophilum]
MSGKNVWKVRVRGLKLGASLHLATGQDISRIIMGSSEGWVLHEPEGKVIFSTSDYDDS